LETYLTIEGLAEYLKLSEQTVRRWGLNREVPYHKIKKVIRFRVSEIEKWVDGGGVFTATEDCPALDGGMAVFEDEVAEGDLFDEGLTPEETTDDEETTETNT
jgi:excisionase family DNA binding protein